MLTSKIQSIVISDASFRDGNWHVVDDTQGERNPDGFDALKIKYAKYSAANITLENVAVDFPIGNALTGRQFWTQGASGFIRHEGGVYEVTITYKGLYGNQPVVVDYDAAANQQSVADATIAGVLYAKTSVHQNTPTASARYITLDAAGTATNNVGTQVNPPSAPATAPNFWATISEPVYNYPNGWVLMSAAVKRLPGTNIGLVVDSYQYIQAWSPS